MKVYQSYLYICGLFGSLFLCFLACQSSSPNMPITSNSDSLFTDCQQLVVVNSASDTATTGILKKYHKQNGIWQVAQNPHPVTLGKSGLAWGYGLHPKQKGYHKQEGDGKSPAGIFTFGTTFGYADATPAFKLPYVPLSAITQCIEDTTSNYYNQIVNDTTIVSDWNSADFMRRKDDLYKWGVFVNHNVPAQGKRGSCIFFHLWRGANKPTLGCTAMTETNILALLNWLDPDKKPMLVQLTDSDYQRFKSRYKLP